MTDTKPTRDQVLTASAEQLSEWVAVWVYGEEPTRFGDGMIMLRGKPFSVTDPAVMVELMEMTFLTGDRLAQECGTWMVVNHRGDEVTSNVSMQIAVARAALLAKIGDD